MIKFLPNILLTLLITVINITATVTIHAQTLPHHSDDWPDWAYGLMTPISENDRVAPPCPDETIRPIACAYIGSPDPDDGIKYGLPDTSAEFTRIEIHYDYGPADWYPDEHPAIPPVVAYGKKEMGFRACSLCHYHNGQGKMENGHVAGLPKDYILQQLELFATGKRRSADIRKANTNEMAMIAAALTEEEKIQIAEYYSSIPFKKMVRVVETNEAPQVRMTTNGLMLPLEDKSMIPLGLRIIEVPEFPERTEIMRDPHGMFISYVPIGSIEKGMELVKTGGGKTIACNVCHGEGQTGLGQIPSIAGRTASYTMRQLWDMKQGTRHSPQMVAVIANLKAEDMLYIATYLASLSP